MATSVAKPEVIVRPASLPGRRFDHLFFATTSWMMLAAVVIGFGPTYYFAGAFRAPLPNTIIHIHGAVFSCWILMLVTQTSLVSAHRVDLHRKLGLLGFGIACVMVPLGWIAATDRLARGSAVGRLDPYFFYMIPVTDMVNFAVLIALAYRARRDPATHKRLIYIGTVALLTAAFARWHLSYTLHNGPHAAIVSYVFLVILIAYDLFATHRIHRATLCGSAFLIFVQQVRLPIAHTAAWHSFAAWIQTMARAL